MSHSPTPAKDSAVDSSQSGAVRRTVSIAAIQFACTNDVEQNLQRAENLVRQAARRGANIILLQELFASLYFPIDQVDCSDLAVSQNDDDTLLTRFQTLAKSLGVVLPVSFFEQCNNVYFNSIVIFDADGRNLGVYRKSHIPDGPGYQEKFYFTPGQTGFKTFQTSYGRIGVAICWDQWFPEAARCMALDGAEILLYPTAIGTEPQDASIISCPHWRRCIQGHAAANMVPIVTSNRIGKETASSWDGQISFYGSSFITDHLGAIVAEADAKSETIITHTVELNSIRRERILWGLFRDRRPDLYGPITTYDGNIVRPHISR